MNASSRVHVPTCTYPGAPIAVVGYGLARVGVVDVVVERYLNAQVRRRTVISLQSIKQHDVTNYDTLCKNEINGPKCRDHGQELGRNGSRQ